MKSVDSHLGYSVAKRLSGKTGVISTGRVLTAFGQGWGSSETCSMRDVEKGDLASGDMKARYFMVYVRATREEGDTGLKGFSF